MASDVLNVVLQLREQGLTDNLILAELSKQGYDMEEAQAALAQADEAYPLEASLPLPRNGEANKSMSSPAVDGNVYERIEEIAENMIDEKWDELIAEVKKIIEWKEKVEDKQRQLSNDLQKLKEDFQVLHQGVLGKLEVYDNRMRDVGTELKAVGKVFRDVIPEFVENVKELSSIKNELKKSR